MRSGLNVGDPTVVAAFRAALIHQGLIAALIFGVLVLVWVAVHEFKPAAAVAGDGETGTVPAGARHAEPAWRLVLRTGFGLLWVFDGILQAQPKMAVGLPSQVIEPTAASSPAWVQHVVNWAGTTWSFHPMQAGASAVWIQVGIGIWLIVADRGAWSRLAALASIGWGLVVWVFGESFGGVFAPGLTWLFGAPGAVLIYAVAGALIALPERHWREPGAGRLTLGGLGVFLVGMAVLQAWPGRGFWQGTAHGQPGTLTSMVTSMAGTPQPGFLSGWVAAFGSFEAAHGFTVNLFAVTVLAVCGVVFLTGRPRLILPALIVFTVVCLADWVLIEDLGFLGGLGTDPNSMVPFALLAAAGYLALTQPAVQPGVAPQPAAPTGLAGLRRAVAGWRGWARPAALRRALGGAGLRSYAAVGAVGVAVLGAAPMAVAQASPVADTILAQAIDGSATPLNIPEHPFTLTDQHGQRVSLARLRGKVVLLTFLDPVCVTDCPLEAQELRDADQLLGASADGVELVAVNLNPAYSGLSYIRSFDTEQNLTGLRNWLYLTGTPAQLAQVWKAYGIDSQPLPGGSMLGHSDIAFAITRGGRIYEELDFNPGPGTQATKSSFAAELTGVARHLLGPS